MSVWLLEICSLCCGVGMRYGGMWGVRLALLLQSWVCFRALELGVGWEQHDMQYCCLGECNWFLG